MGRTAPTTPVDRHGVHLSVLPHGVAAFLPLERSQRPRLPFRGLLGIHSRCGRTFAGPTSWVCCPQGFDRPDCSVPLPGSYQGVPTLPWVELSSTGFSAPSWRTLTTWRSAARAVRTKVRRLRAGRLQRSVRCPHWWTETFCEPRTPP